MSGRGREGERKRERERERQRQRHTHTHAERKSEWMSWMYWYCIPLWTAFLWGWEDQIHYYFQIIAIYHTIVAKNYYKMNVCWNCSWLPKGRKTHTLQIKFLCSFLKKNFKHLAKPHQRIAGMNPARMAVQQTVDGEFKPLLENPG